MNSTESDPLISIVICTHNRAAYLGKAMASALAQDVPASEYELIVIDNGSTDNFFGFAPEPICINGTYPLVAEVSTAAGHGGGPASPSGLARTTAYPSGSRNQISR